MEELRGIGMMERSEKASAFAWKRAATLCLVILATVIAGVVLYITVISPAIAYNSAEKLEAEGKHIEARDAFLALGDYRDAQDRAVQANYNRAKTLFGEGKYLEAKELFLALGEYRDAKDYVLPADYNRAQALFEERKYLQAKELFLALGKYQDAQDRVQEIQLRLQQSISVRGSSVVALKYDGTVMTGVDKYSKQYAVTEWADIVAVSNGSGYTVGLKSDGTVLAAGDNSYGQCDVSEWTDIVAIAAGAKHTVGLKSNGTVVAVGDNLYGQ